MMLNLQQIPVKVLSLDTHTRTYNRQPNSSRVQKHKNYNNFLFMRMTNHTSFKKEAASRKEFNQTRRTAQVVRPKSSFNNVKPYGDDLRKKSHLVRMPINPECQFQGTSRPLKRSQSPPPSSPAFNQQETLKNFFPQRKPKKNKDKKWREYYTLVSLKPQIPIIYHQISTQKYERHERSSEQMKNMRSKTIYQDQNNQNRMHFRERRKQNSQLEIITDITPWETGDLGWGLPRNRL